jgi:hypothetical protein
LQQYAGVADVHVDNFFSDYFIAIASLHYNLLEVIDQIWETRSVFWKAFFSNAYSKELSKVYQQL